MKRIIAQTKGNKCRVPVEGDTLMAKILRSESQVYVQIS